MRPLKRPPLTRRPPRGDDVTIKVNDVAFVRFQSPDLDGTETFLNDFGMRCLARDESTLYMRGTNGDGFLHCTHLGEKPDFIGFAFSADSEADLQELSTMDGFSKVCDLDGPGGGRVVRAIDPNGFQVEVVAERHVIGPLETPTSISYNTAESRSRKGAPVRLGPGPSHVLRLGHCVLNVLDFRTSETWYKTHVGLVTSDEIKLDDDTALGAFLRCDRGEHYVDHHSLFLVGLGRAEFNHAAFEVADFDDLMRGHSHLKAKARTPQWGIGRHVLGSQIYDYWLDPHGYMLEHWTDGDLFNNQTPPNIAGIDQLLESQWGPTHGGPPA
jgi:catechol 2,3-dioxygenase-like lactoylglutathione lyase family enzyme